MLRAGRRFALPFVSLSRAWRQRLPPPPTHQFLPLISSSPAPVLAPCRMLSTMPGSRGSSDKGPLSRFSFDTVLLIGAEGETVGEVSRKVALERAAEAGLSAMVVNQGNSGLPVVRLMVPPKQGTLSRELVRVFVSWHRLTRSFPAPCSF
jgi:hypothetical protein